jgi:ATP-dependent Clp protease ATP-binding subunit ClpB
LIRFDKFTQKAQEALQQCQALAGQDGAQVLYPLHLLVALCQEQEGIVRPVLEKCGVQPDAIVAEGQRLLNNVPKVSAPPQPGLYASQPLNEVLERAFEEAGRFKDEFVSTEHLLLAIAAQKNDPAAQLLERAGATHEAILKALVSVRGTQRVTDPNPETKYQALERYAVDLTQAARDGKLDPVIGREEEIRRVMQVLSRRTKNNPVLIGEPGVGKTAIVEGLAQRIVKGDVPDQLIHKRLVALDLGSMVAGTKFRGEFEDRLKAVLREITESNGEIICFIDELHTLVGAGSAEGAIDAANMLKPALARGDLRCIGATTLHEYKRVEKDAALARRFQTVLVGEPSVDDTVAILRGLKEKFEIHHGVRIKDSAIVSAALLSHRYITDRFLPDKAIDLIDEAGAALRLQIGSMPIEIDEKDRRITHLEIERQALGLEKDPGSQERLRHVESELELLRGEVAVLKERWNREKSAIQRVRQLKEEQEQLRKDEEQATRAGDWEKAAQIRYGRLSQIEKDIHAAEQELEKVKDSALLKEEIDDQDIARIVAKSTGIPVSRMLEGEVQKLVHMAERLKERVVGQDEAVRLVSNAILRNRAGLSDPNRPIGSFIFLGPTGVGKTELVRALAEFLFDDEKAMIRVDMSEYMEKHSVARMIGAPPGYVGYEEGGQLTEQVRRRPYSVLLFDEIEKAHPDVFNSLLQILEDGRLTDGQGRTVNFKNTVIVMTSNVGSTSMREVGPIGFSVHTRTAANEATRTRLLEALRNTFRPEFLNRIDDIIVFNSLSRENLAQIIEIQLRRVGKLLKDRGLRLELTEAARDLLIREGYDPQYGARPMRRAIQRLIQDPLALKLLNGDFAEGDTIEVDADQVTSELRFQKLVPVAA